MSCNVSKLVNKYTTNFINLSQEELKKISSQSLDVIQKKLTPVQFGQYIETRINHYFMLCKKALATFTDTGYIREINKMYNGKSGSSRCDGAYLLNDSILAITSKIYQQNESMGATKSDYEQAIQVLNSIYENQKDICSNLKRIVVAVLYNKYSSQAINRIQETIGVDETHVYLVNDKNIPNDTEKIKYHTFSGVEYELNKYFSQCDYDMDKIWNDTKEIIYSPLQSDKMKEVKNLFDSGEKEVLLSAICRSGKTFMSLGIIKDYLEIGKIVIFYTSVAYIKNDVIMSMRKIYPTANIGIIQPKKTLNTFKYNRKQINFAFLSTEMCTQKVLSKDGVNKETKLKDFVKRCLKKTNFLIIDEAHLGQDTDIQLNIVKKVIPDECRYLYLTGTPYTEFLRDKNQVKISIHDIYTSQTKCDEYLFRNPLPVTRLITNEKGERLLSLEELETTNRSIDREHFLYYNITRVWSMPTNVSKQKQLINECYKKNNTGILESCSTMIDNKSFMIKCSSRKSALIWYNSFKNLINERFTIDFGGKKESMYTVDVFLGPVNIKDECDLKDFYDSFDNDINVHIGDGATASEKINDILNCRNSKGKFIIICEQCSVGSTFSNLDSTINFSSNNVQNISSVIQFLYRCATGRDNRKFCVYYDYNYDRVIHYQGKMNQNYVNSGVPPKIADLLTWSTVENASSGIFQTITSLDMLESFNKMFDDNYVNGVIQSFDSIKLKDFKIDFDICLIEKNINDYLSLEICIDNEGNIVPKQRQNDSKQNNKNKKSEINDIVKKIYRYISNQIILSLCYMNNDDYNFKSIDYIFKWMECKKIGNYNFYDFMITDDIKKFFTNIKTMKRIFKNIVLDIKNFEFQINKLFNTLIKNETLKLGILRDKLYIKKKGEVYLPYNIAQKMIDEIPIDFFKDKNKTLCDTAFGGGIFLKLFVEKCLKYQEDDYKTKEERLSYILKNRVFGCEIQTKNIFTLLNDMDNSNNDLLNSGHIVCVDSVNKIYQNDDFRGYSVNQDIQINNYNNFDFWKESNVHIDCVISNPPYQEMDSNINKSSTPIYHKFVQVAKELNPEYIVMIIPARWYTGGKGLDTFRYEMLNDNKIIKICDYPNTLDCFNNVDIQGGVCYFVRDEKNISDNCLIESVLNGNTTFSHRTLNSANCGNFIRYNQGVSILEKVKEFHEDSFMNLVSKRMPFGFESNFSDFSIEKKSEDDVKIYTNNVNGYISVKKIKKNTHLINTYKVFVSRGYGFGKIPYKIISEPIIGEPNSCCTETYLCIGPFETEEIAHNVSSYIKTKFFRFLLLLLKNSQDTPTKNYQFVPLQDFNETWTDEKLYKKYDLTQEEIDFIESIIKKM